MFFCCECCVLSGRGLCDGLITRPEEFYRLCCVVVCDQETSKNEEAKARNWAVKGKTQWVVTPGKQTKKLFTVVINANAGNKQKKLFTVVINANVGRS